MSAPFFHNWQRLHRPTCRSGMIRPNQKLGAEVGQRIELPESEPQPHRPTSSQHRIYGRFDLR